jgi:hypothetical protein
MGMRPQAGTRAGTRQKGRRLMNGSLSLAIAGVSLLLALGACSPKEAAEPAASAEAAADAGGAVQGAPSDSGFGPDPELSQNFSGCTWKEYAFGGVIMGAYDCPGLAVVVDEALPGLVLESPASADGPAHRSTRARVFGKGIDGSVEEILPALRAASPGPFTDTCELKPWAGDPSTQTYVFAPTGAGEQALADSIAGKPNSDAGGEPCGPLGQADVGDRVFRSLPDAPGLVVFLDLGSEISQLDVRTLRAAK